MIISEVISFFEELAHPSLQESYDNAGLIVGDPGAVCKGILVALDATEEVIAEAADRGCNLVVAHHPVVFKGLKRISGSGYVGRTVISAIRKDIAIYALHTNLDNVLEGVNGMIASKLGLQNCRVLDEKPGTLKKLYTCVPFKHLETVRDSIFKVGAGQLGKYSECSFNTVGRGTFKAGEGADPFVGEIGKRQEEEEVRLEIVFPSWKETQVVRALKYSHPYEEVAYEVISLDNRYSALGSGLIGELPAEMPEKEFLNQLHQVFEVPVLRHTALTGRKLKTIAVCGGAGSFLTSKALGAGAQAFVSADFKYHEFFDAEGRILIADIGHYESEQYTIDLLKAKLEEKFPTFAVLKTGVNTNPVRYSWL